MKDEICDESCRVLNDTYLLYTARLNEYAELDKANEGRVSGYLL